VTVREKALPEGDGAQGGRGHGPEAWAPDPEEAILGSFSDFFKGILI